MATIQGKLSGTKYVGTRIDYYEVANSTNVESNTSKVHIDAFLISLDGGHGSCQRAEPFYVTVGNETKSVTVPKWNIAVGEVWKVGSFDFTVSHNGDGSKTVAISSNYNTNVSNLGSSSLKASLKLTDIPRASSVGCSDFYIESSTTITINSANQDFRHTLKYNFGNLSGIVVEKTALTSFSWTPNSEQFYAQIPNDIQKEGIITCETYNDNNLLGTKTCNFTARVDKNKNIPNISLDVLDVNEVTKNLTGNQNSLIKYFSNAKATITASAKNSASINSYFLNGSIVQKEIVINNVETNEFVAKTVDSRNIEGFSEKVTKNFVEYIKLAIKSILIERENPTSDQVYLNFDGIYFNGSFGATNNALALKVRYKKENGEWSSYSNIAPIIENNTFKLNNYNLNQLFENASFNYQNSYTFEFYVEDKLMNLNQEVFLKRGLPVVAYGENFFHVYGDIECDGKIYLSSENEVLDYEILNNFDSKKIIKLKDNNYLDTSSVVHNQKPFHEHLMAHFVQLTYNSVKNYVKDKETLLQFNGNNIKGTYLTQTSNSKIIVNDENVKALFVTAHLDYQISQATRTAMKLYIKKNGSIVIRGRSWVDATAYASSEVSIPGFYIDVSKDDYIEAFYEVSGSNGTLGISNSPIGVWMNCIAILK